MKIYLITFFQLCKLVTTQLHGLRVDDLLKIIENYLFLGRPFLLGGKMATQGARSRLILNIMKIYQLFR